MSFDDRDDPCKDAYYRWAGETKDARNFIASNLGILAMRDPLGSTVVTTTDLRTSEPEAGVEVTFRNFQDQAVATVTTGPDGMARIDLDDTPFYVRAEKGDDRGYLKMSAGSALATSHFDVGGATVTEGLKGFVYGERGVWRPGDTLHLTFVAQDEQGDLPEAHPATLQLFDPRGRRVRSVTNTTPRHGFWAFSLPTDPSDPTGTWTAAVTVGGARFAKALQVETVVPNRLRVDLDFGARERLQGGEPVRTTLTGQWLSGVIASELRTDVELTLRSARTTFDGYAGYEFDDPARRFSGEPQQLYDGFLDTEGRATFEAQIMPAREPAGFMTASFLSRVFERGGAFSTSRTSMSYSPFDRYVGVRIPMGDARGGTLLTDTTHSVEIATLGADGAPVSVRDLRVTLYKIDWRWWWDRSGESLAQYASSQHRAVVDSATVSTTNGRGAWPLRIDYPSWGRYLLRVCDTEGGHCTGSVFYVDWPGWAGRPQDRPGIGANVLTVTSDREEYTVGETATIELPEAEQGRALVTVENGSRILDARWVELRDGRTRIQVPVTDEMSPTAYVGVSLIQPHEGRDNDRPIRLYGIVPLAVTDPATHLDPVIDAPEEWRPDRQVSVSVSESSGRPMTYTLAVVDEGLLGLTSFRTPDLHAHFYQKEALGVRTWDVFDEVVGAYGGALERLLALGGGDGAEVEQAEQSRYPPVVRFLGPFDLKPGAENEHRVDLPQYIGAVRLMVVAGRDGAYGSAEKSVFVREPLSLLATVPRVVGPEEEITLPVSLFAMTDDIRQATVRVETDDHFEVVSTGTETVEFDGPGERMALLRLRVGSTLGTGRILVSATSGEHSTRSEVFLNVRSPNPSTVRSVQAEIEPGGEWTPSIVPHGLPGTNQAVLELTTLPPLNLEQRLSYLVRASRGSVERVVSAAFPQIYLPGLVEMTAEERAETEENVRTAIDRLRGFQGPSGAFTFWPGGLMRGYDARNSWSTSWVGHFLIEAERHGYYVPPALKADWLNYQRAAAQSWSDDDDVSAMDQAYRLYTLALAGRAEMGAMNRLRASGDLGYVEGWLLAASYGRSGLRDVADAVAAETDAEGPPDYRSPGWSWGSRLRDQAIRLTALVVLEREDEAEELAAEISAELYSNRWHSTHTVAFSLMAMAELYGVDTAGAGFVFERRLAAGAYDAMEAGSPIHSEDVSGVLERGEDVSVRNTGERILYASLVVEGIPASGAEVASASGLAIDVTYLDPGGRPIDVRRLMQGTDFAVRVTVRNTSRVRLDNLELEQRVPAGWEILNPRMTGETVTQSPFDHQDVRDDRIHTYFGLDAGESRSFTTLLNATYLGTYYQPSIVAAAMYDATKNARTAGFEIRVTERVR